MNYFSFFKDGKGLYCLIFTGFLISFSSSFGRELDRHSNVYFQQNKVHGTVSDGSTPLPGVTISIKGKTNNSSITDYNGQYTINALTSDTLIVSFIGFKTKFIPVNNSTKIDIKLEYDTTTLQEVRVNAGYYSVKESDRTGSIGRITSKDIETQPVTNVLATMQGRMAGVNITQTTGVPGGGFDIKIRGQNSLRNDANSPLYVIDGVPYASDAIGSYYTGTIFPTLSSPLNSINPDNIESIEVLKDADATSIYGSRGANGVVLITTKKGRKGKTAFTVNASTGAGRVTQFLKLMDTQQYLEMRRQAFKNDNIQFGSSDYDVNGAWNQNRSTNWQKKLQGGTSQIYDIQASISGGSENTQFLLSGSHHTETTVFPGNSIYKKGGIQFNLNHQSENKKFKLIFSAGYNLLDNNLPTTDFTYDSRTLPPNAPALYDSNRNLNWENGTWINPIAILNSKFEAKTNDLISNCMLSYELTKDLFLKTSLGFTSLDNKETRIIPSTITNPIYNVSPLTSSIYLNNTDRLSWIAEPQINWSKEIVYGKIDILFGATFQNQRMNRFFYSASGFSSNSLIYNIAAASTTRVLLNDETHYKYQAFFGRLNYNLNQKYILNITGRRDGSSRFGPGNQFANFGAAGLAWLFSKENFMQNLSWLSFGKIRSSYGTTGNDQIGDYQFLDTYTSSGLKYQGSIGLVPSRLYNPDFGWETNKKLEIALELGFFQDRIFATAAWYKNQSSNQLVGIPFPGTTGFNILQSNLNAKVANTGIEVTLQTTNIKSNSLKWTSNLNLSFSQTRLVDFPGLESSPYSQQYRIGHPLNIALLYKFKGVNSQTGLYEFEDLNQDGKITFPEDRQYIADLNPKYYGGIQNQFYFKNLTIDFLFQFVKQKNRVFPMGPLGLMSNQRQSTANIWQNSGDTASYQLATTGYNNEVLTRDYLFSESDASITDASFIRLKNISLTYDLPQKLSPVKCRLFLQGQNLLTFTKYTDGDPEFTSYGFLPPLKVITLGVQLTF
ncbi:SusC/RagA family TonB-linked outer membrane protein [Flavobacterium sp. HJSW_4]|uniref:SusC/RagA family TonB-linked outer membrane protein n=1 Tax=Flavobacterium sp. HJSW_4 TaxID=3344660 RepID=UPI0035F336B0